MLKYPYIIFCIIFILFFLGLSLISPGGLLVLDFITSPFTQWQGFFKTTLQWHLVDAINYVFGYELTSKMYYIFVFIFGLFTAHKLGNTLSHLLKHQHTLWILQAAMAIFLLCNPWTYERLVTQPGIALGMLCIALGIHYLIENIINLQKYSLLWASISFGFAFMLFPHASVLILLIAAIYMSLFFRNIPWKYYLIAPVCIILPNLNWLIGSIWFGAELGTTATESFDWANIQGFMGNSLSGLGVDLTHLLLYGFWGERYHILTPNTFNAYWYIFGAVGLMIILWGNILLYKLHKKIWIFLTLIAFISYVLALGIASPIFGFVNTWLYTNIDWYVGMREPQKWLGITMISYSIFFVIGIISVKQKLSYMGNILFLFLVFALLNAWNPMNIFGYQSQLYGITIPPEYSLLVQQEIAEDTDGTYLVLPWHTYMGCSWTRGKIIASQQDKLFYPLDTIVSDNLEISTKYSNSTSPVSKNIETFLQTGNIDILKQENITAIIFQKGCAQKDSFEYLSDIPELILTHDDAAVSLYTISYE